MTEGQGISLLLCAASGILLIGLAAAGQGGQAREYRPVTDAMALNLDPADWIHFTGAWFR